ncbi:hypothetical protein H0W26_04075 [Candidatus Dependentiae bacterium]|nr:hypothetical protein [Candidatus Dependentiae bacterium]
MKTFFSALAITIGLLASSIHAMESCLSTAEDAQTLATSFFQNDTVLEINEVAQSVRKALLNNEPLPNILFQGPRDTNGAIALVAKQLAHDCDLEYCYFSTPLLMEASVEELVEQLESTKSGRKKMIVIEEYRDLLFSERDTLSSLKALHIQSQVLAYTQCPSSDQILILITSMDLQHMSRALFRRISNVVWCKAK